MDLLNRQALAELLREASAPCVSIFLSSTRTESRNSQDRIRFKNLLRDAEAGLIARGVRKPVADDVLRDAHELVQNDFFWSGLGHGLAAYAMPGRFRHFAVPVAVDELVIVNDRPYIRPVLDHCIDGHFFLLALSHNGVRFFRGTRRDLVDRTPDAMPRGRIRDVLGIDEDEEQKVFRGSSSHPGGGAAPTLFHRHGGAPDVSNDELRRMFIQVDGALHETLKTERAPLVLAGVEYLFPVFRDVTTYRHVLEQGVAGNPEGLSPEVLHQKAWPIVEPSLLREREAAKNRFLNEQGTGRASSDVSEIVPAAHFGRVDALFVAQDAHEWGHFDAQNNVVHVRREPGPGDQDLLDFAAVETLLNGGAVYSLAPAQSPGKPAAAVFRF